MIRGDTAFIMTKKKFVRRFLKKVVVKRSAFPYADHVSVMIL